VILVVGSNQILVTITNPETEETIETSITVTVVPTPVIDNCPNGDYTGDLYDEQCGQAPEQENPQPRRSRDSKAVIMTDEDLGICEE